MSLGRLGVIAGNGPLPGLAVEEARRQGLSVTVAAILEETEPCIERLADNDRQVSVHWMGVGHLGALLKIFRAEGVEQGLLVGQVKHVRIFAPGSRSPFRHLRQLPDLKMLRLLASLKSRNTSSLIEAVIATLEEEGIKIIDSTTFLRSLLASKGVMTRRKPTCEEKADLDFGYPIAREIARLDLGQTIAVKDCAVVAVEAMEGTDETIRRAHRMVKGEKFRVVKVSRPNQDMRFDVPVVGPDTLKILRECNVSALALDAERTLLVEKPNFVKLANEIGLALVGFS